MPYVSNKRLDAIKTLAREIKDRAGRQNKVNFSIIGPDAGKNYPTNEQEANEFVRSRIRIWLQWFDGDAEQIIDIIDEIQGARFKKP